MLSSVLRSKRAVQVNIAIMRAFAKLREPLTIHKKLARKLEALERKYDAQSRVVLGKRDSRFFSGYHQCKTNQMLP